MASTHDMTELTADLLFLPETTYTPPESKPNKLSDTDVLPTNDEQPLNTSDSTAVELQLLPATTYIPLPAGPSESSALGSPNRSVLESPIESGPAIYFTPVSVTGSQAELSDPQNEPRSLPGTPTPTQETFDKAVAEAEKAAEPAEQIAEAILKITPVQFEQLARAFIEAPVVKQRILEPLKEANDQRENPEQAMASGTPMKVRLRGVAVTDSKQPNAPIRYTSTGYRESPNVLNSRGKSFLNVPYGGDYQYDCYLHVEQMGNGEEESCKVLTCVVSEVLDRWTGTTIYNLVAEVDITQGVTAAILAEVAAHLGMSSTKIEVTTNTDTILSQKNDDGISVIDWYAVADELQSESELSSIVDNAGSFFALLDESKATQQTSALIADLERFKRKHRDFVMLSVTPHPTNPQSGPAKAGVPWISSRLEAKIHVELGLREGERRTFRARVVEAVAKKAVAKQHFFATVPVAGKEARLFCAPLEAVDKWAGDAWVCFVVDL